MGTGGSLPSGGAPGSEEGMRVGVWRRIEYISSGSHVRSFRLAGTNSKARVWKLVHSLRKVPWLLYSSWEKLYQTGPY